MTLVSKGPPLPPEVAAELEAALYQDMRARSGLKLNITREWFERKAALEGDLEIGAGGLTLDEDLKLAEQLRQNSGVSALGRLMGHAATTITRLHAEITQRDNTIDGLEFQRNEALSEIGRLKSDAAAVMPPCG